MPAEIYEIVIGLVMMTLTTFIHGAFMIAGMRALRWRINRFGFARHEVIKAQIVAALMAWMFLAIVVEAWLWAVMYLYHPQVAALGDLGTALYFSMVTYTTLGYGDVVLTGPWRLLASLQAANGVIIFGWTTALVFVWLQHIYLRRPFPDQG